MPDIKNILECFPAEGKQTESWFEATAWAMVCCFRVEMSQASVWPGVVRLSKDAPRESLLKQTLVKKGHPYRSGAIVRRCPMQNRFGSRLFSFECDLQTLQLQ